MSVVAFSFIDQRKALEETVSLRDEPEAPLAPPRTLILLEHYCVNPECDCAAAHIEAYRIPGGVMEIEAFKASLVRRHAGPDGPGLGAAPAVRVVADLGSATVEFPDGHVPMEAEKRVCNRLRAGLTEAELAVFKRHYAQAKAWANENHWKYADWSGLEEGICVAWLDVFPKAEIWHFESAGKRYFVDDQYCVNPDCDCAEAVLPIHEIHLTAETEGRGEVLGVVIQDLETGRRKVDSVERGRPEELLRAADAFFASKPGVGAELRRRYGFMRDFGRRTAGQWKRRPARVEPAAAPKPGRNEPCLCGSGKKFKKCCLG